MQHPLTSSIFSPKWKELLASFPRRSYPQGSKLMDHLSYQPLLYYIFRGEVLLLLEGAAGKERILEQFQSGDFIALPHTALTQSKLADTWSLRIKKVDTEVVAISSITFWELTQRCPELMQKYQENLQLRLEKNLKRLATHLFLDVTERIVGRLSELAVSKQALSHPKGIQIRSTREEIGQWAGCSRETVGRALKLLEIHKKLSARGKTITLYRPPT